MIYLIELIIYLFFTSFVLFFIYLPIYHAIRFIYFLYKTAEEKNINEKRDL